MAFKAIRTAAYVPVPGAEPYTEFYYALAFPAHWRQSIISLSRQGKRNPDSIRQVPIRSLNEAIRAVAPDLVSVAENAVIDDAKPWLYTANEYPASVIKSLVVSWLHTLQSSPEAFSSVRAAVQELDLAALNWDLVSVDLTEHALTDGGTALPAPHLYRLLPEVLAARIERSDPYEYCGAQVSFRRVASDEGAELISWPPSEYLPRAKKGEAAEPWHFSAVIGLTLRTVPFSLVPRIHVSTGIRRYVRGRFRIDDRVGVYLLTDGPWLADAPRSSRFAKAYLEYDRSLHQAAWKGLGPEGIMSRLSPAPFPPPAKLAEEPGAWLDGRDGVTAAVTYHTAMGYHGVHAGLMPSERQRLTEWAGRALEPHFRLADDLVRSDQRRTRPRRTLQKLPEISQDPEKQALAIECREKAAADNAVLRRANLARAIQDTGVLTCHVLYQSDQVRDAILAAAEQSLGLSAFAVAATENSRLWRAPEVAVKIEAAPLGRLGGPLGEGVTPRRGKQAEEAIRERRQQVREFVAALSETSQVAFIELEGRDAFWPRTTDPKLAIRLGCADAGRVSQFITPVSKDADNLRHRADAAWADGIRQLGISFTPVHTVDGIPAELAQLAFWIVRRNSGETTSNKQFTPVAILIRPDQNRVMGRIPGMQGWVTYPELLLRLTGLVRGHELRAREQQRAETARFIRQVLYSSSGGPTVVLARAQNMRPSWTWLEDGKLVPGKIQLGNLPPQDLGMYGRHLRLIRVRDSERNETPQSWAPKDDQTAGIATGLWVPPDSGEDNRVFYATTEKASTHSDALNDDTKLTAHVNGRSGMMVTNRDRNAWNPTLLEIAVIGGPPADDPEDWAMVVQQQRIALDDYRDMLKLPLALHLAELAGEYALPYGDERDESLVADRLLAS
ncbi:MAG TPA: DUF3962 domain-containing protein [Streptosporangiaceae bacterium]|nr:DUF3962 domain-containing protein [Streptosporangiaceae bacterium]